MCIKNSGSAIVGYGSKKKTTDENNHKRYFFQLHFTPDGYEGDGEISRDLTKKYVKIFPYALYKFIIWWQNEDNRKSFNIEEKSKFWAEPNNSKMRLFIRKLLGSYYQNDIFVDLNGISNDLELMGYLEIEASMCEEESYLMKPIS
jgi:hypothetical protein